MIPAVIVSNLYSFIALGLVLVSLVSVVTTILVDSPQVLTPTLSPTSETSRPTVFGETNAPSYHPTFRPTEIRPNFIFLLADDLGINMMDSAQSRALGLYDGRPESIKTPQLSRLASLGAVIQRHLADSPVCSPSRYALFTGIPTGSKWSRVRGNLGTAAIAGQVPDQRVTLGGELTIGEELQRIGYVTAAFGKTHMLDEPHTYGFNYSLQMSTFASAEYPRYFPEVIMEDTGAGEVPVRSYTPKNNALNINTYNRETNECNLQGDKCEFAPDIYQSKMLEWIGAQLDANRPFFVYMGFLEPHDGKFLTIQGTNGLPVPSIEGPVEDYTQEQYAGYFGRLRQLASSVTNSMDKHIGELVDFLQERDAFDNTVIIFTTDNGGTTAIASGSAQTTRMLDSQLGPRMNQPYRDQKRNLLFGGTGVPCIVTFPKLIPAGSILRDPRVTVHTDLTRTILDMAGAENIPDQFAGTSIIDDLRNANSFGFTSPLTMREFIFQEICLDDRGRYSFHDSCDFSILFTRQTDACYKYKVIYARTDDIDRNIQDFGNGFTSFSGGMTGNLTIGRLRINDYTPYVFDTRNVSEPLNIASPARINTAVRACITRAEEIVLAHRIVPTAFEMQSRIDFRLARYNLA